MGSSYRYAIGVLVGAATLTMWAPEQPLVSAFAEDNPGPARLAKAAVPLELCRLPVVTLAGNGFVTYPAGVYTPDPSGTPTLPPSNQSGAPPNYGYTYDAVYSRWLPVMPSLVSPDGAHYVFMDSNANLSTVDVRTGRESQLTADGSGAWHPVGWQPAGIYAIQATSAGPHPGLWLVPYPSGSPKRVTDLGYWEAVGPGAAYGYMESMPPTDTSFAIVRLDLASGTITKWFYEAGQRGPWIAGFDRVGAPVIQQSIAVYLVPAALQPQVLTPSTKTTTAYGDSWGLWLGSNDGLSLFAGGQLTQITSTPLLPVGRCSPELAPDRGGPPPVYPRTYTVRGGDTLFTIAQAFGLSSYWPLFWRNEGRPQARGGTLANPGFIRPGWILAIPAEPLRTYVVRPGDSLSLIAQHFYGPGHGGWWRGIYDANRDMVRDAALVYPGEKLRIP
jgi:nucleoid-associated protein YgaU